MDVRARKGCLFTISAPSGAGKTTIVRQVLMNDPALAFSVSHTTRGPREGEQDGIHYHFIDEPTFAAMRERGEFLEWAPVHGKHYGTARREVIERTEIGMDVILDIDLAGAQQVHGHDDLDATFVFVLPPSFEELRDRLVRRGTDSPEQIEQRLRRAREEIEGATFYDYYVVNRDLDRAVAEVRAIIAAERLRARRNPLLRQAVLTSFR